MHKNILLTEEILKKNNIIKTDRFPEYRIGTGILYKTPSDLFSPEKPDGYLILVENTSIGTTLKKKCRYVYELEKMLELAEIDKNIEV